MNPETNPTIGAAIGPRGIAVAALLLLFGCAPAPPPVAPEPVTRVRIVHTNDFHGRLEPQAPSWAEGRAIGGSAVLAAHFDSARARFNGPTFLFSGGDDYQGTAISNLSWGRATAAVQNAKRYDAAALGNHEFDWGQDTLRARLGEAVFPRMGANIYGPGTREHPDWVQPWVLLERDGVRVGVIGIALSTTPEIVMAGHVDGLEFRPEAEAIDRYAREARAAGADFVVVTAHVGANCDGPGPAAPPEQPSEGCRGEIIEIAEALSERVDLIVAGHTHERVLTTAAGIPIIETPPYSTHYSVTDLERRGDSVYVVGRGVYPSFADEVDPDTAVTRLVAEWGESIRPLAEREIATFAEPMSDENRAPGEYPLGNLLADAQRIGAGAHVSLVNNGSLRRSLPAGTVNYGMLYEFQPFQNQLVTLQVSGALLRAALEHALGPDGVPRAHVSGLTVLYSPDAPAGARVRELRLDDGRTLADTDQVTLGTSEFVAGGGDGYGMLRTIAARPTGIIDLDAFVQLLQSLPQPVAPPAVGRWVVE